MAQMFTDGASENPCAEIGLICTDGSKAASVSSYFRFKAFLICGNPFHLWQKTIDLMATAANGMESK
ncbi:MAG TPA: hypothetical protein VG737_02400 [Cyclobacteriaceae bacterium]|nr:hypothetical protein [Cyclobacteriaceae bacterium]